VLRETFPRVPGRATARGVEQCCWCARPQRRTLVSSPQQQPSAACIEAAPAADMGSPPACNWQGTTAPQRALWRHALKDTPIMHSAADDPGGGGTAGQPFDQNDTVSLLRSPRPQ
jgi:hypothetical protein